MPVAASTSSYVRLSASLNSMSTAICVAIVGGVGWGRVGGWWGEGWRVVGVGGVTGGVGMGVVGRGVAGISPVRQTPAASQKSLHPHLVRGALDLVLARAAAKHRLDVGGAQPRLPGQPPACGWVGLGGGGRAQGGGLFVGSGGVVCILTRA